MLIDWEWINEKKMKTPVFYVFGNMITLVYLQICWLKSAGQKKYALTKSIFLILKLISPILSFQLVIEFGFLPSQHLVTKDQLNNDVFIDTLLLPKKGWVKIRTHQGRKFYRICIMYVKCNVISNLACRAWIFER